MNKYPLIRTIYLYVFALAGLSLVIIGAVQLVNLGLKTYIFKHADDQYAERPFYPPEKLYVPGLTQEGQETVKEVKADQILTKEEKDALERWLVSFQVWEQRQKEYDPVRSGRHRTASIAFALILVGLPVFLYHWGVIQREVRHQKLA